MLEVGGGEGKGRDIGHVQGGYLCGVVRKGMGLEGVCYRVSLIAGMDENEVGRPGGHISSRGASPYVLRDRGTH